MPHALENIGCGEAPGDGLSPPRQDIDGIKNTAERGKNEGGHPSECLHLMAPVNDAAGGEESKSPSKDQKRRGKRQKSPSYGKYIQRIEKIDKDRAKANCNYELAKAEADDP